MIAEIEAFLAGLEQEINSPRFGMDIKALAGVVSDLYQVVMRLHQQVNLQEAQPEEDDNGRPPF